MTTSHCGPMAPGVVVPPTHVVGKGWKRDSTCCVQPQAPCQPLLCVPAPLGSSPALSHYWMPKTSHGFCHFWSELGYDRGWVRS